MRSSRSADDSLLVTWRIVIGKPLVMSSSPTGSERRPLGTSVGHAVHAHAAAIRLASKPAWRNDWCMSTALSVAEAGYLSRSGGVTSTATRPRSRRGNSVVSQPAITALVATSTAVPRPLAVGTEALTMSLVPDD